MSPIAPGATLGILGGGQLARMTALAARSMGYGIRVLDPDRACAAAPVADEVVAAPFDDADAAARLARGCAVVTIDVERIGAEAVRAAARHAPVRPLPESLALVRDRLVQKTWLEERGFPVGPFEGADDAEAAARAVELIGRPCRLKARRGGYDGRSQARARTPAEALLAARALAGPAVVERELALEAELSVLVARSPSGAVAVHPPARNWARAGVLDVSVLPSTLSAVVERSARDLSVAVAEALSLEGILVVELFLVEGGRLLVNELAQRPHNTYHHAGEACATGQFEQLVRAICDLPLGDTSLVRPAALANLLGAGEATPAFREALAVPGTRLHLYGKASRPGRKIGHLVSCADTPEAALANVRRARASLGGAVRGHAPDARVA
jgi:5-(carboxyamino)imidazole ribonucleotide synthase